jgi:hypothetical protein
MPRYIGYNFTGTANSTVITGLGTIGANVAFDPSSDTNDVDITQLAPNKYAIILTTLNWHHKNIVEL